MPATRLQGKYLSESSPKRPARAYNFVKGRKKTGGMVKGYKYPPKKRIAIAIDQQIAIDAIFAILVQLPIDSAERAKAIEWQAWMETKVKRIVDSTPCKRCRTRMRGR